MFISSMITTWLKRRVRQAGAASHAANADLAMQMHEIVPGAGSPGPPHFDRQCPPFAPRCSGAGCRKSHIL